MLTKNHKTILDEIFRSGLREIATWGGGTALSEIYLHHRKSEDIDIILSDLPQAFALTEIAGKIKSSIKADEMESFTRMNRFQYFFNFKSGKQEKLEFVYYPFLRLEETKKDGKILVESLRDIAVSKTLASYQRKEPKDAFDLYEILKQDLFSLKDLTVGVEEKFGEKIDTGLLLSKLNNSAGNFDVLRPLLIEKNVSKNDLIELFQQEFNRFQKKNKL